MLGQMLCARTGRVGRPAAGSLDDLAEVAHVLDRDDDLDLERLADAGVDDGDRPRLAVGVGDPPRKRAISSSGRCVADRPMRCGGALGDRLEPLERQHEVGAALGGGERVDLVDDDRLDVDAACRAPTT